MTVSEKDRDYFRRLGEWKAANHAEALREHLAKPPLERLAASFAVWRHFASTVRVRTPEGDPTALYERARRLGFYRP